MSSPRLAPLALLVALVAAAPAAHAERPLIVIDPGHGGGAPGASGNSLVEKVVVLDVARRFRDLLLADDADPAGGGQWAVKMTRSDDTAVSLTARSAYANSLGASRFMSIHGNGFGDTSANGIETFSLSEGTPGAALRNLVQGEMISAWGLRDRGSKVANYAVLRETAMPAVLHELAFITNVTDAKKLASPAERQKAAVAHLRAIQRHFGLAPYLPGSISTATAGSLSGTVNGDAGPLAGAAVSLAGKQAVTSASGGFVLEGLTIGEQELVVSAEGSLESRSTQAIVAGQATEVTIDLVRGGDTGGGDDADDGVDPVAQDNGDLTSAGCATSGRGAASSGATLGLILVGLALASRRSVAR
jgi:N-acetylmuramoyl-L-alanine amidase